MTDAHTAPAVVRAIVETRPERETLLRQLEGAHFGPEGTNVDIETAADAPTASLADGPVDGRYLVTTDGEVTGEVLVWMTTGLVASAEYAWYTDDPPESWPDPGALRVN